MTTIQTRQLQQYTRPSNNNYAQDNLNFKQVRLYKSRENNVSARVRWLSCHLSFKQPV